MEFSEKITTQTIEFLLNLITACIKFNNDSNIAEYQAVLRCLYELDLIDNVTHDDLFISRYTPLIHQYDIQIILERILDKRRKPTPKITYDDAICLVPNGYEIVIEGDLAGYTIKKEQMINVFKNVACLEIGIEQIIFNHKNKEVIWKVDA